MRSKVVNFLMIGALLINATTPTLAAAPTPPPDTAPNLATQFVDSVMDGINQAHARGMTPIIRVGVGLDASGMQNPADYVTFLTEINNKASGVVYAIAGPNEPETEPWVAPQCGKSSYSADDPSLLTCLGPALATYMNAVIAGAGSLPKIRLLSPAFNIGSYVFPSVFKGMNDAGANWGGLYGIAANAYNVGGQTIQGFVDGGRAVPGFPTGKPMILTEIGDFDHNVGRLTEQVQGYITNAGHIEGALFFNAFGTNPDPAFQYAHLSDGEINGICGGACNARKVGINFATFYTTGDYVHAADRGMKFTLEILGAGGGVTGKKPTLHRLEHPCVYVIDPEQHPLRPYPYNPCDPFIPASRLSFACGNSLDVDASFKFKQITSEDLASRPVFDTNNQAQLANQGTYKIAEDDLNLYRCADDQTKICAVKRTAFNITVDFPTADLPVIGSTERAFSGAQASSVLMNNYLSWYLQGSNWSNPSSPATDSLINYSGPMRKLFPQKIQDNIRVVISKQAGGDIHNYLLPPGAGGPRMQSVTDAFRELFTKIPLSTMEDAVGEITIGVDTTAKGQPEASAQRVVVQNEDNQTDAAGNPVSDITKNAMRLHISRNPAAPNTTLDPFSDGRTYMPHLRETLSMTNFLKSYANPAEVTKPLLTEINDAKTDLDREDALKNLTGTPDKNAHKGLHNGVPSQVNFEPIGAAYGETPTRNTEIIDTYENAMTVTQKPYPFQSPFTRYGKLAPAPVIPFPVEENIQHNNGLCGLQALRVAPGDSLVDENGWKIKGLLTYTQTFKYDPIPPANPAAGTQCKSYASVCGPAPYYGCIVPPPPVGNGVDGSCGLIANPYVDLPTTGRVTVSTQTPFISQIYKNLVSGTDSILHRFLPRKTASLMLNGGTNCPGDYLKGETGLTSPDHSVDSCVVPVATKVTYGATNTNYARHENNDAQAVKVQAANGGATGELFFPYLGSVQGYILGAGGEMLNLQRLLRPKGMMSAPLSAVPATTVINNQKMVILVVGQSNAASFGQTPHTSGPNVFCLNGGTLAPATDPLCGTGGAGGSPWTRLGDMIINAGMASQVIFVPAAVGSTDVGCWVAGGVCRYSGGNQSAKLQQAISDALAQGLTITHVLWHQGESDNALGTTTAEYESRLLAVIKSIRDRGVTAPFYPALATACFDPNNPLPQSATIRNAQLAVINPANNVLSGPDTDTLGRSYRTPGDECHFSNTGLTAHAQAWFNILQSTVVGPNPGGNIARCDPATSGPCTVANLTPAFGVNATKAASICHAESGGVPIINPKCPDYSVGLFQINLIAHGIPGGEFCPAAFSNYKEINKCTTSACFQQQCDPKLEYIVDLPLLQRCTDYFMNVNNNINYAAQLSNGGTNFGAWSTNRVCFP